MIGSGGKCAVIDPRRDCEIYTGIADRAALTITHIFETHRNEDYAIGSIELAARTDAEILHGHQMNFGYGRKVKEGDIFSLGQVDLKILETPGHTLESISVVVTDRDVSDKPYAVFTGDASLPVRLGGLTSLDKNDEVGLQRNYMKV
jgi:hydroxyacylglutathione hydrolase